MTETADFPWTVYMVQCSDGSLYTGVTTDLERRLAQHNNGRGAKYTRARRPVRLVYAERAADKGAALRREIALKRLSSARKRRLINAGTTT